jgi:hypothetical protein
VKDTWPHGWIKFPFDRQLAAWVTAAKLSAHSVIADVEMQRQWLQCQGTWFVGVDALPNDLAGRIGGSGPLAGHAVDFIRQNFGTLPALHPAQLSVIYPGYPKPRAKETPAAFRFRQTRDAAHIDGILPQGPNRQRNLIEPHAFVLGIPLNHTAPGASPLVVWPDSPAIVRRHLATAFASVPVEQWPDVDVTEIYAAARREVFANCERLELSAQPGEAYLLHRLALHGVAPWTASHSHGRKGGEGQKDRESRMVAYFRPPWLAGMQEFLNH